MKNKPCLSLLTMGTLLGSVTLSNATVIGFGQIIGGSNSSIEISLPTYGSNATADSAGVSVSNGITPNISVTWSHDWDIHESSQFAAVETQTVGGGLWDNGNNAGTGTTQRVGQLDTNNQFITFNVTAGYALVLNSFDFGQTGETSGTTSWSLTLTDSSSASVWSTSVSFTNGQVYSISPGFTGIDGEDYTLTFLRTSADSAYTSLTGRHAIDNLSFNQVTVPEPATGGLLGLAGLALLSRRRRE